MLVLNAAQSQVVILGGATKAPPWGGEQELWEITVTHSDRDKNLTVCERKGDMKYPDAETIFVNCKLYLPFAFCTTYDDLSLHLS